MAFVFHIQAIFPHIHGDLSESTLRVFGGILVHQTNASTQTENTLPESIIKNGIEKQCNGTFPTSKEPSDGIKDIPTKGLAKRRDNKGIT